MHLGRGAAERAVAGRVPGEGRRHERRALVGHPVDGADPADAARLRRWILREAPPGADRRSRRRGPPGRRAARPGRSTSARDDLDQARDERQAFGGSTTGPAGSLDWPLPAHVADHRDRPGGVVEALDAPGRDGRVVHRAVEREVHLHVPFEPIDSGRRSRRCAARSPASPRPAFAITFQCPGGVSDFGPSAQYSASTRAKSPRGTTCGSYGWPVAGLTWWPVPSLAPSGVAAERARADVDRRRRRWRRARLLRRMISTACVLERLVRGLAEAAAADPGRSAMPVVDVGQRERRHVPPVRTDEGLDRARDRQAVLGDLLVQGERLPAVRVAHDRARLGTSSGSLTGL